VNHAEKATDDFFHLLGCNALRRQLEPAADRFRNRAE